MKLRLLSLAALSALLALASMPASAQKKGDTPGSPEVFQIRMEKVDLSPPLRSMQIIAAQAGVNAPVNPTVKSIKRPSEAYLAGPDTALQSTPGTQAMPTIGQSFDGVSSSGSAPPDTQGDVGPNHYVQWVNTRFAVYSKTGTLLLGPTAGNTLWSGFGGTCQTTNAGDPITLFDPLTQRWVMSQFTASSAPYKLCVAVSTTSDPTGTWYRYAFDWPANKFPDYPKWGVWPNSYFVTVNQFTSSAGGWQGAGVAAFEKDKMVQGLAARGVFYDLNSVNNNFGGMLPADLDGYNPPPANAPGVFVEVDDASSGFPVDQMMLWNFTVDWSVTPTPTSSFGAAGQPDQTLPVTAFNLLPNSAAIPQPGTTQKLDSLGDRSMYRLAYRNLNGDQRLVFNHSVDAGSARAGVRWYELQKTGASWAIRQQGTYAPAGTLHRWMGSVAMDNSGAIAAGYSTSGSTAGQFPSLAATGRLASDPADGTMTQAEATYFAGLGVQGTGLSRFGDYSMMGIDPADDCTFWFTSEYLPAGSGTFNWKTRVISFKYPGCTAVPIGTLTGTVKLAASLVPVVGATVTIPGGFMAITDATGTYTIKILAPGPYSVTAAAPTYASVTSPSGAISAGGSTVLNFLLGGVPAVGATSFTQTAESCTPSNSVPDPNENVSYSLCLSNTGGSDATNVVATLQAGGGVVSGSAQNYGSIPGGGAAVCKTFAFQISPSVVCGGTVTATFVLADGATTFPNVVRTLQTGVGGVCATTCLANQPPTITPTAGGITVARGTTTNNVQIATVTDSDTAPPTLLVSALGAPAGITIANIVLTQTSPGNYSVKATIIAACTAAASGPAALQVTDGTAPVMGALTVNTTGSAATATLSGGATLCAGESATLSVALTGASPWTLTWSDAFVQSGITSTPGTRTVTPAGATTYTITSVADANGCGATPTGAAVVTVNPRPTAMVTGGGTICAGTVSPVTATLTGTAPWTITWNDGVVQTASATPATRLVSPTVNTTYALAALADAKCAGGTSSGAAAFVVKPLASATITASASVCYSSTGNTASVPDGGLGVTYAWGFTGGTITSATNTNSITYTANASGNVVLNVTVTKDGCPNVGTKTIPIQTLPAAPVPAIPANGSAYQGASVSWTHPGGARYDVYVDTVSSPEKLIFSGETSNFEAFIPSWVPGVTYYWKVVAQTACGSASSPVWSFVAGACPWSGNVPVLTSPANGATGIGATATLKWNSVAGTAHYDVYVGTSAGNLMYHDAVQAPQTSVLRVSPATTYYWKVVAVPVCGSAVAATSTTSSFTTGGTAPGLTAFTPLFLNRWETGAVQLTGSGFTSGMTLFTDFHGATAGTLIPGVFTNPNQLQGTLIGNPSAQAGRYDVGVAASGVEKGRMLQTLAVRAFTDVTENDYYYSSSARMADAGIMESDFSAGTAGPQFSPATNVTRALMAEYLAKSYQYWRTRTTALPPATCVPAGAGSTDFPDVACSHENWLSIHWIKVWGVTTGSPCPDGLCFNPTGSVNRAEMVTFIERLRQTGVLGTLLATVGEKDPGCATNYPACKGWSDAGGVMDVAAWPRREANLAFSDRITSGCGGTVGSNLTFCPYDSVTRGQIGEFLARTLGLVPMP